MIALIFVGLCAFPLAIIAITIPTRDVTRQPGLDGILSNSLYGFDDIPTPKAGLISLSNPYRNLSFTSFSVFNPHSDSLTDLISPHDLNCAVSAPNALLGSRDSRNGTPASFKIANATAMRALGLQPTFTLHSLKIKPMAAPEPGTDLIIKGYRDGKRDLAWSVWFPSGYHRPLEVYIEKFSRVKWEKLKKVEIFAEFGYGRLDWEFCVDDLVVELSEAEKSKDAIQWQRETGNWEAQVVLHNG